jgi:hypothetical protein
MRRAACLAVLVLGSFVGCASAQLPVITQEPPPCERQRQHLGAMHCVRTCEDARRSTIESWQFSARWLDEHAAQHEARLDAGERILAALQRAYAISKKRPLDRAALERAAVVLKDAEDQGKVIDPSSRLVVAATADALLAALSSKDDKEIKFAFENDACVNLAMQRGGASKLPELEQEVAQHRATMARFAVEQAAVHAALDAALGGDRAAAASTAHAASIGPDSQTRLYDYAESQRTTDDFVEMCR